MHDLDKELRDTQDALDILKKAISILENDRSYLHRCFRKTI